MFSVALVSFLYVVSMLPHFRRTLFAIRAAFPSTVCKRAERIPFSICKPQHRIHFERNLDKSVFEIVGRLPKQENPSIPDTGGLVTAGEGISALCAARDCRIVVLALDTAVALSEQRVRSHTLLIQCVFHDESVLVKFFDGLD